MSTLRSRRIFRNKLKKDDMGYMIDQRRQGELNMYINSENEHRGIDSHEVSKYMKGEGPPTCRSINRIVPKEFQSVSKSEAELIRDGSIEGFMDNRELMVSRLLARCKHIERRLHFYEDLITIVGLGVLIYLLLNSLQVKKENTSTSL